MLRYPGGKIRLMPAINELIKEVYEPFMEPWVVAEPFTGGGGSLLKMAEDFTLWTFHLNDLNPMIASMWRFFQADEETGFKELYDKIRKQKVTIAKYKDMLAFEPKTPLENTFKVIFLNKTSFGGMIEKPAPIGGYNQDAEWKIDEFWKPETIIRKIAAARRILKGRILSVSEEDFESFINRTQADFFYADPPYLANGDRWYAFSFNISTLARLKNCLVPKSRWCVSIDRIPESEELFSDCNMLGVDVTHTSRSSYKSNKEDATIGTTNEIVAFPKDTKEI